MNFQSDTSGIDALIAKIAKARAELSRVIHSAAQRSGDAMSKALADKAPHGQSGGAPPAGDGPGSLAGSFHGITEQQGVGAKVEVKTTQPQKLEYVREGTGLYGPKKQLIKPTAKKALFWPGAAHPYRSVKGMRANDFVKPVIARASEVVKPEMDKAVKEIKAMLGGQR